MIACIIIGTYSLRTHPKLRAGKAAGVTPTIVKDGRSAGSRGRRCRPGRRTGSPQVVADDRHRMRARRHIVRRRQQPPLRGVHAEHVEEVSGDDDAVDELGRVPGVAGWRVMPPHAARPSNTCVPSRRAAYIGYENTPPLPAVRVDEPVAIVDGQALKQGRVDETEDRGVRADAERQRQNGGGRETRLLSEPARRVAESCQRSPSGRPCGAPGAIGGGIRACRSDRMCGRARPARAVRRSPGGAPRGGGAAGAQLVVALVEMLRQLVDDLRAPARGSGAATRDAAASRRSIISHGRLP